MANEPLKPPVRVRLRTRPAPDQAELRARLAADSAAAVPKKRKPNAGSMKPGETRNPNGRPKGAKGTKAMVRKLLSGKTAIRDRGRPRKVTLYQALLLKELQLAIDGDWRARQTILALGRWALPEELPQGKSEEPRETSSSDQQIIDWFMSEFLARANEGAPE